MDDLFPIVDLDHLQKGGFYLFHIKTPTYTFQCYYSPEDIGCICHALAEPPHSSVSPARDLAATMLRLGRLGQRVLGPSFLSKKTGMRMRLLEMNWFLNRTIYSIVLEKDDEQKTGYIDNSQLPLLVDYFENGKSEFVFPEVTNMLVDIVSADLGLHPETAQDLVRALRMGRGIPQSVLRRYPEEPTKQKPDEFLYLLGQTDVSFLAGK